MENVNKNMKEKSEQKECILGHDLKSLMQDFASVMGSEHIFKTTLNQFYIILQGHFVGAHGQ